MLKKLFVCSYGEIRSPTAVNLFGGKFLPKGLSGASPKTIRRMFKWADVIYVFEDSHIWYIKREYPEFIYKVISLDTEDIYYKKNDPELINKLKNRWWDMYGTFV